MRGWSTRASSVSPTAVVSQVRKTLGPLASSSSTLQHRDLQASRRRNAVALIGIGKKNCSGSTVAAKKRGRAAPSASATPPVQFGPQKRTQLAVVGPFEGTHLVVGHSHGNQLAKRASRPLKARQRLPLEVLRDPAARQGLTTPSHVEESPRGRTGASPSLHEGWAKGQACLRARAGYSTDHKTVTVL